MIDIHITNTCKTDRDNIRETCHFRNHNIRNKARTQGPSRAPRDLIFTIVMNKTRTTPSDFFLTRVVLRVWHHPLKKRYFWRIPVMHYIYI